MNLFLKIKLSLKIRLLSNYAQIFIFQRKCIQILEYCVNFVSGTEQSRKFAIGLSGAGAFDYNHVFLGIFSIGMDKLH